MYDKGMPMRVWAAKPTCVRALRRGFRNRSLPWNPLLRQEFFLPGVEVVEMGRHKVTREIRKMEKRWTFMHYVQLVFMQSLGWEVGK